MGCYNHPKKLERVSHAKTTSAIYHLRGVKADGSSFWVSIDET